MPYTPQLIDLSHISLPPDLDSLVEEIAQQVHERWATERFAQGWRWGPVRSDAHKEHPCLTHYQLLPDREKEFDRQTAIWTLKMAIHKGFDLVKRQEPEVVNG